MRPATLHHYAPETAGEAQSLLADEARVLAGGQSVTPMRLAASDSFTGFWRTDVARRHGEFPLGGAAVAAPAGADRLERCAVSLFRLGPGLNGATTAEREALGTRGPRIRIARSGRGAASAPTARPDRGDGLSGDRCRCTGYQGIVRAARRAAATGPEAPEGSA